MLYNKYSFWFGCCLKVVLVFGKNEGTSFNNLLVCLFFLTYFSWTKCFLYFSKQCPMTEVFSLAAKDTRVKMFKSMLSSQMKMIKFLMNTLPISAEDYIPIFFFLFWSFDTCLHRPLCFDHSMHFFPPFLLMWDYSNLYIRDFFFYTGFYLSKHDIHSRQTIFIYTASLTSPEVINQRPLSIWRWTLFI